MEQAVDKLGTIAAVSTGMLHGGREATLRGGFINILCPTDSPLIAHTWRIAEQINKPFY
jgi:hypothetical protein